MVIEGTLALTGPAVSVRPARAARDPPGPFRGLQQDRAGRAPPRRLRDLVPAAEGARSGARQADPGQARRDAAVGRRGAGAAGLPARRRVRVPRVHEPGDERVRVHRAVSPAEGDRRGPARRHGLSVRWPGGRPGLEQLLQPHDRGLGQPADATDRSSTPGMNDSRSIESWRIVSVWPTSPKITSWWATSPGSRTEWIGTSPSSGAASRHQPRRSGRRCRSAHRACGRGAAR